MHTGFVAAEFGQPFQIGYDARSVDGRHSLVPFLRLVEVGPRVA